MSARVLAVLALFALMLPAASAFPQCSDWKVGPFDYSAAAYGADGPIYATTLWDPDGAGPQGPWLVVGGAFSHINGVAANNLARRDPATGQWQTFTVLGLDPVHVLAVYNGELIIGGSNIYRWNGSAPVYLGGGIFDGTVNALTVYNGNLIMGGSFRMFPSAGSPILYVGQWDGSSWQKLGGGINNWVYALTVWGGDLIVGGAFNSVDQPPISASAIARWNGSWSALGTGVQHGVVEAFAAYYGGLYVGGSFTDAGAVSTGGLARWDGGSWASVGGHFSGDVWTLAVFNDQLVMGGLFGGIGGSPNIAQYSYPLGSYSNLGSGGTTADVYSLYSDGELLYAGGSFTTAGGVPANNLARWNGEGWAPMGGGIVAGVLAMTNYGGRLVVGGGFTQSTDPGLPAVNIVGWNGATMNPYGSGVNGQVNALKSYTIGKGVNATSELVAGGYFTQAGGVAANYIARWDQSLIAFPPPAWQAMGSGFDGAVLAIERATIGANTNTYAAGPFVWAGPGVPLNYLGHVARWNATTQGWENLAGGTNGVVYALKAYGGFLYAGGSFTTAGGVSTGGLARWDGSSWSVVDGFFGGTVYSLEVHNGALVIGGSFPGTGGVPNITSWLSGYGYLNLGTSGASGPVLSLHSTGTRLYAGGSFQIIGAMLASRVAYWDGTWHPLTAGADDNVYALGNFGGEALVGGAFNVVGSVPLVSPHLARFTETGVPWFVSQPFGQTVNPGGTATFTAQPAPGYPGVTEQWYRNGVPLVYGPTGTGSFISGSTTPTVTISNISNFDYGSYQAVLSSGCGNDTSGAAMLNLPGSTGVPGGPGAYATAFEAIGPNPSRGATMLSFSLERASNVRVRIHDVAGRRVGLIEAGLLESGQHQLSWDGRDETGRPIHSGFYFVSLEIDGRPLAARRVTVVR